jgi:hypothetical protein
VLPDIAASFDRRDHPGYYIAMQAAELGRHLDSFFIGDLRNRCCDY